MTCAQLLTLAQVSERLHLSVRAVRRLVDSGALRSYSLGRSRRVCEGSVGEYLCRSQRHNAVSVGVTSTSARAHVSGTPTLPDLRLRAQAPPTLAELSESRSVSRSFKKKEEGS